MPLGFIRILDADGNVKEILADLIDDEGNRYAQVSQTAFGPETDIVLVSPATPLPMSWYDSDGVRVGLTHPDELTASPTILASAADQFDSLNTTPMTFAGAANGVGKTGRILGARLVCKHDTFAGTIVLHLFRKSVTGTTAGLALAVSDTDKLESIGALTFDFSAFPPMGGGRVATANRAVLPLDYKCDVGTSSLFGILQLTTATAVTFAAADLVPFLSYVAD